MVIIVLLDIIPCLPNETFTPAFWRSVTNHDLPAEKKMFETVEITNKYPLFRPICIVNDTNAIRNIQ